MAMIEKVIEKWHAHMRGELPGGLDELLGHHHRLGTETWGILGESLSNGLHRGRHISRSSPWSPEVQPDYDGFGMRSIDEYHALAVCSVHS